MMFFSLFKKKLNSDFSLRLYFYLFFNTQTWSRTKDGFKGTASVIPAPAIGHGKTPPRVWTSMISSKTPARTLVCNCRSSTPHTPRGAVSVTVFGLPEGLCKITFSSGSPWSHGEGESLSPVTADPHAPYEALEAPGKDCFWSAISESAPRD